MTLAFTVAGITALWVANTVAPPKLMTPVLASLADALPLLATIWVPSLSPWSGTVASRVEPE